MHSKPLIDHLKRKHEEEFKKEVEEAEQSTSRGQKRGQITKFFSNADSNSLQKMPRLHNITFHASKEYIQELAVEAVTVNGLPLSVFEKSALSKLMEPILSNIGISLNRKATRSLTMQAAEKKIAELKPHLYSRMVSIKTDLCTRRGRHFIGINIQTVIDGELKIITAAVKEMTGRATGAEIRKVLLESLQKFGINETNIYTLTTDNGANVVKAGEIMKQNSVTITITDDTDQDENNSEDGIIWENEECASTDTEQLEEALNHVTTAADGVISVRCAAHTLQLCVHDMINGNQSVKSLLTKVRKIVNKTHTQNMRLVFRKNDKPLPKLDCETRWGSSYEMLQSVMASKSFLCHIGLANESLLIPEDDWQTIVDLLLCLKPVYDTTVTIQMQKLTAGMFLGEWLKCKMLLSKSSGRFSADLITAMENRELSLLNNAAFLAAIYLDPRFQCLLVEPQKDLAKLHLTALWKRITSLQSSDNFQDDSTKQAEEKNLSERQSGNEESSKQKDIIDQILSAADNNRKREREVVDYDALRLAEIKQTLRHFNNCTRIEKSEDILKWWDKHPHQDMKAIAEVALALPVTQVSVERTFSGLRYILDELRLGMKDDIIDAIMFLRCNT